MKTHAIGCAIALILTVVVGATSAQQRGRPGEESPASGAPEAPAAPQWRPAPANLAAFHVMIGDAQVEQGQPPAHRCAGVAVARNWVLISALCIGSGEDENLVEPSDIRVFFGPRIQVRTAGVAVDRIVRHPQYNAETTAHDLALVRTSVPLPASVTPASLPAPDAALPQTAVVVGWQQSEDGNRRTLVNLSMPFVDRAACRQAIRARRVEDGREQFTQLAETLNVPEETANSIWTSLEQAARFELAEGIACAAPPEGYPCDNDPGASLLQVQGTAVTLLGVSTHTEACEVAGVPNQFTLVGPHLDWVRSTIAQ